MQHVHTRGWLPAASKAERLSKPTESRRPGSGIAVTTLTGEALFDSFATRFQVYCRERKFLDARDYPEGVESDEFDWISTHIGAFDGRQTMVGTVRLVPQSDLGLPMDAHCSYDVPAKARVGEISRLAVPRRQLSGGFKNLQAISLQLYRGLYQVARVQGMTHLVSAMEPTLERLVCRMHFPFEPIGPLVDYYGWVRPYVLELDQLDRALAAHAPGIRELFHTPLDRPERVLGRTLQREAHGARRATAS